MATNFQNYGEFITIDGGKNTLRVRKELILGYTAIRGNEQQPPAINIFLGPGWNMIPCESYEAAVKECEKLDWIYKKDLKT
jgi:hypothetical protein